MALEGARVLVVEDEALVGLLLEDMLTEMGCQVIGMAWRVPQALDMAETVDADVALLDVNVAGVRIDPVAEVLQRRNIPFVFATGYGIAGLPDHLKDHPVLTKPVRQDELSCALGTVLASSG